MFGFLYRVVELDCPTEGVRLRVDMRRSSIRGQSERAGLERSRVAPPDIVVDYQDRAFHGRPEGGRAGPLDRGRGRIKPV